MLAIFIGYLTLLLGFAVMLLPLLVTELSRPRDALWGSVFLFLGLVLVTANDLFRLSSMIAVSLSTLVIIRLGIEVALSRWHHLSNPEKLRLTSFERWTTGIHQIAAIISRLGEVLGGFVKFVFHIFTSNTSKKKWVRPEGNEGMDPLQQAITNSDEELQSSQERLEQQPQKTLESEGPPKDS